MIELITLLEEALVEPVVKMSVAVLQVRRLAEEFTFEQQEEWMQEYDAAMKGLLGPEMMRLAQEIPTASSS